MTRMIVAAAAALICALALTVQAQNLANPMFNIDGVIQSLTTDNAADLLSSGKIKVNNIVVTIPRNLVIVFPAAYWTVTQVVQKGPSPGVSGLGTEDLVRNPGSYEASIVGNIVVIAGVSTYLAGEINIAPVSLQNSDGYIRKIDYAAAELCVGASSTPLAAAAACVAPNIRVRINDPVGVYGTANLVDDSRFASDPDNPTIASVTGYPMCIPRSAPPAIDSLCPLGNRPKNINGIVQTTFVMSGPNYAAVAAAKGVVAQPFVQSCNNFPTNNATQTLANQCNPDKQAPFAVGDFVSITGVPAADGAFAATSIKANVGIFTKKGAGNTVYITFEEMLIGTGPVACAALTAVECTYRFRVVGFITDPSRAGALENKINFYYVDVNPATGVKKPRLLADPSVLNNVNSPLAKDQGFFGRFRIDITKKAVNVFIPPTSGGITNSGGLTREILMSVDDGAPLNPNLPVPNPIDNPLRVKANGIIAGQYWAPVPEFIYPEPAQAGIGIPAANFNCQSHLIAGWALDLDGNGSQDQIGPLSPWPGSALEFAAGINCNV